MSRYDGPVDDLYGWYWVSGADDRDSSLAGGIRKRAWR